MKKLIVFVSLVFLVGCTDPKHATKILSDNGYRNITTTGYSFFACSKDDFYHTGFKAISQNGTPISGTVCSGFFFKNSTIRFE